MSESEQQALVIEASSDLPTRFFRVSVVKWLKALHAISLLRPVNPTVGLTSRHMLQSSHGEFRALRSCNHQ